MKKLMFTDLSQAKPTYAVSLKGFLKHFVEHLVTTALGNILKTLDYDV